VPASKTVFMFSGQGSQYFQMGRELFKRNDIFHEWMLRLDPIARELTGHSVIETLYSEASRKGESFDRTLLTHPAIFMVEYALAQALMHAGVSPDMVLGVSMGSFAAATVGGFIEVEDALVSVVHQAIALEQCERGGMIAILANPDLFAEDFLNNRSELAAVNFSSHFVISARWNDLEYIEAVLKKGNVGYQRLPVSEAFHSRWIDKAKAPFESFMRSIRCRQGSLSLGCCDQAAVLYGLSADYFWNVVRRPIRFHETIVRLEQLSSHRYIDVGPAGTLATFLRYGMPASTRSTVHAILTPYGLDEKNLTALLASIRN
jgi:bacillaene synthase trans-acting acyltransferase